MLKFADTKVWGDPTHSARRAMEILDAALPKMDAGSSSVINPSLTRGQVHEIFSAAASEKLPDGLIHPMIAKNIEREFGRYFKAVKP